MLPEIAAIVATIILILLGIFQFMLILGKPYGEYAWGGQQKVLSRNLKIGSGISIIIYLGMIRIILGAAGLIPPCLIDFIADYGIWLVVAYFAIGIIMNLFSRSKKERNLMTPIVVILFLCTFIVAIYQ